MISDLQACLALAEQGDSIAQNRLGVMYDTGDGVTPDRDMAIKWYTRSAEQGLAKAQFNLGRLYESTRRSCEELPPDSDVARLWYEKAALQGLDRAQFALGVIDHQACCRLMKSVFRTDREEAKVRAACAEKWYSQAAEQGHENAIFGLGVMFINGIGRSFRNESIEDIIKRFRRDALRGDPCAQYNLGCCYVRGLGVDKDYNIGWSWMEKSAAQDYEHAIRFITNPVRRLRASQSQRDVH